MKNDEFLRNFITRIRRIHDQSGNKNFEGYQPLYQVYNPCQMEMFWFSLPFDIQILYIAHDSTRDDLWSRVHRINYQNDVLLQIDKILIKGHWSKQVEKSKKFHTNVSKGQRFAERILVSELRKIKNNLFFHTPSEYQRAIKFQTGYVIVYYGNLFIQKLSTFTKQFHQNRIPDENFEHLQKYSLKNFNINPKKDVDIRQHLNSNEFSTYLYPTVWIGDNPIRKPSEIIKNEGFKKIKEIKIGKIPLSLFSDGKVIIHCSNLSRAHEVLSSFIIAGKIHQFPFLFILEHEMDGIKGNLHIKQTESFRGSLIHGERDGFFEYHMTMEQIMNIEATANDIITKQSLSNIKRLALGEMELKSTEYEIAFLYGWIGIEQICNLLYRTRVLEEEQRNQNIKKTINSLHLYNVIDENMKVHIHKIRDLRNQFAHEGKKIKLEDSRKTLLTYQDILNQVYNLDLKWIETEIPRKSLILSIND